MTLKNLRAAVFLLAEELSHITFRIANMCKPFRAFRYGISFRLGFKRRGLLFEDTVKQLLGGVGAVNGLSGLQQVECKMVAIGMKKIMRDTRKPVDHLGSSHLLRSPPGIQIP